MILTNFATPRVRLQPKEISQRKKGNLYDDINSSFKAAKSLKKLNCRIKTGFKSVNLDNIPVFLQILRITRTLSLSTQENEYIEECKFSDIWIYNYKMHISKDNIRYDSGVCK